MSKADRERERERESIVEIMYYHMAGESHIYLDSICSVSMKMVRMRVRVKTRVRMRM